MAVEITLITGGSNVGKSTLTRSLTGQARVMSIHPNPKNVIDLAWAHPNNIVSTAVFGSSLNEGRPYKWSKVWNENSGTRSTTIHPSDINAILDAYENKSSVQKAIICVSATLGLSGWRLNDYVYELQNGPHHINHIVQIGELSGLISGLTPIFLPNRPTTPNLVAKQCRSAISLL